MYTFNRYACFMQLSKWIRPWTLPWTGGGHGGTTAAMGTGQRGYLCAFWRPRHTWCPSLGHSSEAGPACKINPVKGIPSSFTSEIKVIALALCTGYSVLEDLTYQRFYSDP